MFYSVRTEVLDFSDIENIVDSPPALRNIS